MTQTLPPPTRPTASREQILATLFDKAHLITPPAVAMKVVNEAANPDCRVSDLATLISRDPALSAKLLKTVNSSIYGLPKPVASLERAVMVLGLNPLRSLVLGFSLPVMQSVKVVTDSLRRYWVSSVGGAILAREFATLLRRPAPDSDLTAGLLRNLGSMLIERAFPREWAEVLATPTDQQLRTPCEVERRIVGVDHADVTGELLARWKLPPEVVEPIRFHHAPERLAGKPKQLVERAELLNFVELLSQMDLVAEHPALLGEVLQTAEAKYGLTAPVLTQFLGAVMPKVDEFAALLELNIGQRPDFAAILSAGCEEMVRLAVQTSQTDHGTFQSTNPTPANLGWPTREVRPAPATTPPPARPQWNGAGAQSLPAAAATTPAPRGVRMSGSVPAFATSRLPEFRPEFVGNFPPGGCRLDDYELKKLLGRGAMGVVFLGWEPGLRRNVAVKMLTPELAAVPVARERFAREARSAAAVRHENVIGVYAVREAAGLSYLGMEFVDGGDLDGLLEREKHLTVAETIRIAGQMAAGLRAAHEQSIIHRDIKPANIMLANPDRKVKLSDFGLARSAEDPSLTTSGTLVGSPLYMSPEQVRGQTLDARSDLFSLGSVLYAALVGKPPFAGRHVAAVLHNVCEQKPPPPHAIRPDVPRGLSDAVMKLLEKNPADRFQSAAEFATALQRLPAETPRPGQPASAGTSDGVDASRFAIQRHGLRVRVVAVTAGPVPLDRPIDGATTARSKDRYLSVDLSFQHLGQGGAITVHPWGVNGSPSVRPPRLTAGTKAVGPADLGPAAVTGRLTRAATLTAGGTVTARIVFPDTPPGPLTLDLPAEAWGQTGAFRFRIPADMIKTATGGTRA